MFSKFLYRSQLLRHVPQGQTPANRSGALLVKAAIRPGQLLAEAVAIVFEKCRDPSAPGLYLVAQSLSGDPQSTSEERSIEHRDTRTTFQLTGRSVPSLREFAAHTISHRYEYS